MSLHTQCISGLIFPLQERLKGHRTVQVRRDMERTQWLSPSELEAMQLVRLREFLIEIGTDVPFYKKLFSRTEFEPDRIQSLDCLRELPLLGKPEIRANIEEMKSTRAEGLARFNTGGSSGEPLVFFIGNKRVSHDVAAKWRATRWWDVDIGDPEIVVWGSPIELSSQDRVRQFRDRLMRTHMLPAFEMSEANLDRFIAAIKARSPRMLFGYPSALALIAEHADHREETLDDVGIKVAFVTSEALYPHQREQIERVFGCRVANGYGGRDAGFIAHECPSGGMHITADDIIIEIVDGDGQSVEIGETGEIVVTNLATKDFPFVRYRTGDIGALSKAKCECGRGLPLLGNLEGRTTDFLVSENGSAVHALALIYSVRDLPGIAGFKIIQHAQDQVEVYIVRTADYEPTCEALITKEFAQRLGAGVKVKATYCESIPHEKSGKFRYVVSHVESSALVHA